MAVTTNPVPASYGYGITDKSLSGANMTPLLSLGTSLLGGAFSAYSARKQNKAAAALAQKQMDFQERMSSTAYQRSAKDLEAAGLNRILALGNSASSPGGAMAPVVNEGQAAINSALAIKRQNAEIQNIEANTAKTASETINVPITGNQLYANISKIHQEISNLRETGDLIKVQKEVQEALKSIRGSESIIIKSEADLWKSLQSVNAGEAGKLTQFLGPSAMKLVQLFILSQRK